MLIKKFPEDFKVEEIPIEFSGRGDYTIYKLVKKGYNTESAIQYICRKFNINRKNVKYAGAKDKQAITTQYISVYKKKNLSLDGDLKLEFVTFHDSPLSLGCLKGNKFMIKVRDIEKKKIKSPDFVPNYFDEQRFSSHNFEIGLCLLKKDFKKACSLIDNENVQAHLSMNPNDFVGGLKKIPLKILTMYVHAVQSFIFNESLFRLLKDKEGHIVDYSLGKMMFCKYHDDSKLPMVGFDSTPKNQIKEILAELGLKTSDFVVRSIPELSVEEGSRDCFVPVSSFSYVWDDGIILKFSLPKGSYATIVLKAVLD